MNYYFPFIPTTRRLDYIVIDTDPMESGYLYGCFRNKLFSADSFLDLKFHLHHDGKFYRKDSVEWVNKWMLKNNKDLLFTNVNDRYDVAVDLEYFWELRTTQQFAWEEARAIKGFCDRKPAWVFNDCSEARTSPDKFNEIEGYINDFLALDDNCFPRIRRIDYLTKPLQSNDAKDLYRYFILLKEYFWPCTYYSKDMFNGPYFNVLSKEFSRTDLMNYIINNVNNAMKEHGMGIAFRDVTDFAELLDDYQYLWCYRSVNQFVEEEKDALNGKSCRQAVPIDYIDDMQIKSRLL